MWLTMPVKRTVLRNVRLWQMPQASPCSGLPLTGGVSTKKEIFMNPTNAELKITIAKLIEIAYSTNKGATTKIVREKGNFKLTVDQNGQALLMGKAGALTFSGETALKAVGVRIKRVSVNFTKGEGDLVEYKATFSLEIISMSVGGSFDIEELITSCSGMLCKAAKAMKQRNILYENELQKIMGK